MRPSIPTTAPQTRSFLFTLYSPNNLPPECVISVEVNQATFIPPWGERYTSK